MHHKATKDGGGLLNSCAPQFLLSRLAGFLYLIYCGLIESWHEGIQVFASFLMRNMSEKSHDAKGHLRPTKSLQQHGRGTSGEAEPISSLPGPGTLAGLWSLLSIKIALNTAQCGTWIGRQDWEMGNPLDRSGRKVSRKPPHDLSCLHHLKWVQWTHYSSLGPSIFM